MHKSLLSQIQAGIWPPKRPRAPKPVPPVYTLEDLKSAQERLERLENDDGAWRRTNPNKGRAALEDARLRLYAIERQLRARGLL